MSEDNRSRLSLNTNRRDADCTEVPITGNWLRWTEDAKDAVLVFVSIWSALNIQAFIHDLYSTLSVFGSDLLKSAWNVRYNRDAGSTRLTPRLVSFHTRRVLSATFTLLLSINRWLSTCSRLVCKHWCWSWTDRDECIVAAAVSAPATTCSAAQ